MKPQKAGDMPTLTTPCTLAQLMEFIDHVVEPVESGSKETTASVTTTTSTIVVT